jgi:hypothetical protein
MDSSLLRAERGPHADASSTVEHGVGVPQNVFQHVVPFFSNMVTLRLIRRAHGLVRQWMPKEIVERCGEPGYDRNVSFGSENADAILTALRGRGYECVEAPELVTMMSFGMIDRTGWRSFRRVLSSNGRVKPDYVYVNGKQEHHPEGSYYIEWYENRKRVRRSVASAHGNSPNVTSFGCSALVSGVIFGWRSALIQRREPPPRCKPVLDGFVLTIGCEGDYRA